MSGGSISYGDRRIAYAVRRQPERKARSVAIHVEPDGRVIVDAPADADAAKIKAAVAARARWIHRHVEEAQRCMANVLPREYVSGESLLYLGRRYRLRVTLAPVDAPMVRLKGAFIEAQIAAWNGEVVKAALLDWYRRRARAAFLARLEQMAPTLLWVRRPPPFRLQAMKVQWGSCSPAGRLTLNPLLVRAPRECIDYVLLHELCHLREHNHGRRFYRLLDAHMPGWQQTKIRLDNLAATIFNV
jgi:predicted metal-dependent hydrolase